MTKYGEIALAWFDMPMTLTREQSEEIYQLVKKYQPDCLVNTRIGNGLGDYRSCADNSLPEEYTEFIYKEAPFDAFEVLGGENYYAHNGFQTGFYYEMKAKGIDAPVVGSTDSHGSINNRNAHICSTMVFSPKNECEAIIDSIKNFYSIAIDGISKEYRLVGDFRLARYANFLLKQTRFYVKYFHVNEGTGNRRYFLVPHYPTTQGVLWFGLSWNFYN